MNEKKLTALISVLAFGLAGMALVPVGMDAGAEHAPLAQANEGTDHCIPYGPEYLTRDGYAVLYDLIPSTYADELTEVIIPRTYSGRPVTTIGEYAFEYAYYLDRILIPDSVTTIEPGAFHGCYMIRSFTIPDSVTVIENNVFGGCEYLETIILPDTVTQINTAAFCVCRNLTTVILPSQLQSIGDQAFNSCDKLQSVVIHKGLESIGKSAFSDIDNLSDVYFTGTQEEWELIQIAEDNDDLLNATIHFNYEPISKGDLDMDNIISAEDAAMLLNGAATSGSGKNNYFNNKQSAQADVNSNGTYDSTDAAVILRYAASVGSGEKVTLADFLTD